MLPGDGIGPEVTEQARLVLVAAGRKAGLEFDFQEELIGGASIDAHGVPLRDEVIEACRASRAVLLGAVGGPKWDDLPVDVRPERGCWESERPWVCSRTCVRPRSCRRS